MGREIKLRAWDTETKEMSYDFLNKHWLRVCIESPYVELMQYTGLKDKSWKEIYEGDILTSTEYPFQDGGEYNYHGVIEWIDEEASFYMTKRLANLEKRGMSNGISQPIENIEEFEIIGNIYENPELIEV
jgi:uncharacterized phage protein (TIGR01671 family)